MKHLFILGRDCASVCKQHTRKAPIIKQQSHITSISIIYKRSDKSIKNPEQCNNGKRILCVDIMCIKLFLFNIY